MRLAIVSHELYGLVFGWFIEWLSVSQKPHTFRLPSFNCFIRLERDIQIGGILRARAYKLTNI